MISGPTIPNTLGSLRDLVVQHLGILEHGLRAVTEDLVLGHDSLVDVLACDANGAPVLLFVVAPETSPRLPSRVLGAQAWLRQNADWLATELADPEFAVELEPRFVVIGLEILADSLAELRRLDLANLSVLQFCSMTVGGRLRLGITELLGDQSRSHSVATGGARRDVFSVPIGILDPAQRALCARFLDMARKVDTRLTAVGDRFSRSLKLHGRSLADLGLIGGRLHVDLAPCEQDFGGDATIELTEDTCLGAIDRVLRSVVALEVEIAVAELPAIESDARRESARVATSREVDVEAHAELATEDPITHSPVVHADPRPGLDEDRFSLEPIRRSVAQAQLSREEFSALGDDGPIS